MAEGRGAERATLEVADSNGAALALYGRLGFQRAGRRPAYYRNGEDALILWLHLNRSGNQTANQSGDAPGGAAGISAQNRYG
jgi:ribosomal-protein-alanine N-acetyltransferase